ncbi:hypothetical protein QBC32DRAFT_213198 [Pseudoneurospora amorphoporcata]|uniref:Peptidase S8/S53 domain-containing protein n=1 Tax=Pseudoneurospora amorphoporcata TaxID=241081 RepID=A0AAN6NUA5_9PEZI|nr:hypothetical protein QBC32DRAFT_213198 [Pseudoneurospora amorphoporcata]
MTSAPQTSTKGGEGAGLAFATAESVWLIAKLLKDGETDKELNKFYGDLKVYCVLIQYHINRVGSLLGPDNELIVRLLEIFESLIAAGTTTYLDITHRYPRQRALNREWTVLEHQSADDKLKFAECCLNVKGSSRQTALQAPDAFFQWERDITTEYPDSSVDERPRSKRRTEPSYAVWSAAQTAFKALAGSAKCQCPTTHELGVRLCLGTYRAPEHDDKNDFDMFLAFDKYCQETRIRTVQDNMVRFVVSSEEMPARKKRKLNSKPIVVRELCEQLEKMMSKMPAYRFELEVKGGQLFKLESEPSRSGIDKKRPPVSLQHFIKDGSRSLTGRIKLILAVLLSYAVLHLHGTSWLQSAWDSSQVLFFQTEPGKISIRPFIQAQLSNAHLDADEGGPKETIALDDQDGVDPDDIEHPVPGLVTLAAMLMELYSATPVEDIAHQYKLELSEGTENRVRYLNTAVIFDRYKHEIPQNTQFHHAIEKCLDPDIWQDESGQKLDNQTLRVTIYQEVVRRLEDELCDAFKYITIDKLDEIAESGVVDSWEQTVQSSNLIQMVSSGSPLSGKGQHVTPASEYNAAKFYDDEKDSEAHSPAEYVSRINSYLIWKTRYEQVYRKYIDPYLKGPPKSPVKIAVLDSGIDDTHPRLNTGQIKLRRNWTSKREAAIDRDGHGTFIASLIVDYAPDAELYIAKIAEKDLCSPSIIAEAIKTAVDDWHVDIISMSFGYPTNQVAGYEDLEAALLHAHSKSVLMFAAASNSGANQDRAYPARDRHVICVHSTDANGNRSRFNPTALVRYDNIATVGEAIQSAWPAALCDMKVNPEYIQTKSGTSYATPIAVGIAAFLLQYARIHLTEVAHILKRQSKMNDVLVMIAEKSERSISRDGYDYIALSLFPDNLFGKDKQHIDSTLRQLLKS